MIKRANAVAYLLTLLLIIGALKYALTPSPSSQTGALIETLTSHKSQQERIGVSKDLWIANKEGERRHHHITSPHSTLVLVKKGREVELIEEMKEMRCYLQDRVEKRGEEWVQNMRYLEAEEGTYRYSDQLFDAHRLSLAFFELPGQEVRAPLKGEEAYLTGVAKEASFSFKEGVPHIEAGSFKAQVPSKEELKKLR